MRRLLFLLLVLPLALHAAGRAKPSPVAPTPALATPVSATPPGATPAPTAATETPSGPQNAIGLADSTEGGQNLSSKEAQRMSDRGTVAFNHGDLATAQYSFEAALALAPGNPSILINLGLIAYRQKRYADAEDFLHQVVQAKLDTELAWLILGVVYYEQDKLDAAVAALAQATFLNPKDARAHHYLGVTIGKKGWYLGAEDEMRKAIELQPTDPEANFNLAVFYLQRNPPAVELARRHYQRALDLGARRDPEVEKMLDK
jgi:Flp pilus assembly protein TadD